MTRNFTMMVAIAILAPSRAHADDDSQREVASCQRSGEGLASDLEKGGSYLATFHRWEKECITDAAGLKGVPGYDAVVSLYRKLKPIATKLESNANADDLVATTWSWIDRQIESFGFSLNIEADKTSLKYKEALEELATCKSKLSELFASHPDARTMTRGTKAKRETLGDVYDFCDHGAVAKDEERRGKKRDERTKGELETITKTESTYLSSLASITKYGKIGTSNKKYGAMQAARNLDETIPNLVGVSTKIDEVIKRTPALETASISYAGKSWTVRDLATEVARQAKAANATRASLASKVKAQDKQWDAECMRLMRGDRGAIARKAGLPPMYDGREEDEPETQIKKMTSTGTFWIYSHGNCEIRYDFNGNRRASTTMNPPGCSAN